VPAPTYSRIAGPGTPFVRWELELKAGKRCAVDRARYAGALVVVVHGTLCVRTRAGGRRAFVAGSLLAPCWVEAVTFENPGPGGLVLLGVARRTTISRVDD